MGKAFLAHALGHIGCRTGHSVPAVRFDRMLKTLEHARLTNSHEAKLRKMLAVDLIIIDDFGLDELIVTCADPVRAWSAIDRFTSNACDLWILPERARGGNGSENQGSTAGENRQVA